MEKTNENIASLKQDLNKNTEETNKNIESLSKTMEEKMEKNRCV